MDVIPTRLNVKEIKHVFSTIHVQYFVTNMHSAGLSSSTKLKTPQILAIGIIGPHPPPGIQHRTHGDGTLIETGD